MNMQHYIGKASKIKNQSFIGKHLNSQRFAWLGIYSILKEEPNFRIELFAGLLAIVLGVLLKVSLIEFLILILTVGLVLMAEIVNSVVERICDIYTSEHHIGIKFIKDVAAGGVLLTSIISIIVGLAIFGLRIYGIIF